MPEADFRTVLDEADTEPAIISYGFSISFFIVRVVAERSRIFEDAFHFHFPLFIFHILLIYFCQKRLNFSLWT